MTFPPDDRVERRAESFVTYPELLRVVSEMANSERLARHDQTTRISQVIGQNHESLTQEIHKLRIDILTADAEPVGTPAGRSLLAASVDNRQRIERNELRLDSLEAWRDGLVGAFGLVKIALGTSILGGIVSIVALWRALS